MLRKIYKFIDDYITDNYALKLIVFGVFAIVLFIISMVYVVDYTPATDSEYAPLIAQQEEIAKNFNAVYGYDNYEIVPSDDNANILVSLSNKQCKLICSFDKQLKFINYEKTDKSHSVFVAIIISLWFFSLFLNAIITIILTIAIPFIISLLLKLIEKICLLLI